MSNYTSTPSFRRPPSYAQQWPPPDSSQSSMLPQNFPLPSDYSGSQNEPSNMNSFDANSRLPGLGLGAPGPLPPPPFPFMGSLTPSQFPPPPFPPLQMPFLGYPPMPIPTAPQFQENPPVSNETHRPVGGPSAIGFEMHPPSKSTSQYDQEEGEVTDGDHMVSTRSKGPKGTFGTYTQTGIDNSEGLEMQTPVPNSNARSGDMQHFRRSDMPLTQNLEATVSEAEEGETSSVSRASSRASGSPYNPPMSVTAGSPLPGQGSMSGIDQQSGCPDQYFPSPNAENPQSHSNSQKSPVQLRVQAQGALLSLAPHNIRYEELVQEGINPVVLRQLYEEVGIKVATPRLGAKGDSLAQADTPIDHIQSRTAEPTTFSEKAGRAQREGTEGLPVGNLGDTNQQEIPVGRPHSAPIKPMERKEVIARMLAAKAAKASGSPQESTIKEPSVFPTSQFQDVDNAPGASSIETSNKEKETPAKEKNKAQTELARKRIEELKMQGLMRSQQKSQPGSVSQQQSQSVATAPPNVPLTRIQHPLPERPPEPEATSANLPGLYMTGSNPNSTAEPFVTSLQGLALDSTPQPRIAQRKRPRASDFDEPSDVLKDYGPGPENAAPEQRLVIDISDDEFYGDDEKDYMDVEEPALRNTSSAELSGISSSFASQNARGGDQEHLRKKDMEIQAMHRKIAELEHRKKAKLATSNTQSPGVINSLPLPFDENPATMDLESDNISSAAPEATKSYNIDGLESVPVTEQSMQGKGLVPPQNDHITFSPAKDLSSMDSAQLEAMRSMVFRKREIESGLPALEAEIKHSESKLPELQKDEESLLLDIARGRQGRQQLIKELEDLGLELNGLTLEEIEAAQHKLENGKPPSPMNQASTLVSTANRENDASMPDIIASTQRPNSTQSSFVETTAPPEVTEHEPGPYNTADESRNVVYLEGGAPQPDASDSAESAMDESTDSSSTNSTSDSEDSSQGSDESPPEEQGPAMNERAENRRSTEYHPHILPRHEPQIPMEAGTRDREDDEVHVSRASSVASEAYEPPEPESDSSSVDSEYVPAGPSHEGPDMTEPFPNQPPTDESLTGSVQEIGADSSGRVQNAPETPISEHKFSSYISPLRYFKSFRYHPSYSNATSDGYRSLTYSHNIDAMKYLCSFEAAGGVCNDRSCEAQHFRDMTLSDDKILVQMGSLREGRTPEEKDQYITGLKQIINDMRRDKVKDFNTVAAEIVAYRRRFLQDSSRVLPL